MLNLSEVQLRLIRGRNLLRVLREEAELLNGRVQFWEDEIKSLREREAELQEETETEEEIA